MPKHVTGDQSPRSLITRNGLAGTTLLVQVLTDPA
jgi:hypothetical protein